MIEDDLTYAEISIHALREEGDTAPQHIPATLTHFYPRPPRGGRPRCKGSGLPARYISIHALREEGDTSAPAGASASIDFYPRPPRGGRRLAQIFLLGRCPYFYPRPPRGGRPRDSAFRCVHLLHFYPRPPRGGRPVSVSNSPSSTSISIHALREEGDVYRDSSYIGW